MLSKKRKAKKSREKLPADEVLENEFIPQGVLGGKSVHRVLKGTETGSDDLVAEGTIIVSERVTKKE